MSSIKYSPNIITLFFSFFFFFSLSNNKRTSPYSTLPYPTLPYSTLLYSTLLYSILLYLFYSQNITTNKHPTKTIIQVTIFLTREEISLLYHKSNSELTSLSTFCFNTNKSFLILVNTDTCSIQSFTSLFSSSVGAIPSLS